MALTNFNDENTYTYYTKRDAYGYSIFHMEGENEVWDDAYTTLEVAEKAALAMTLRDSQRAAEARERNQRLSQCSTPSSRYYSITGYYGD